MIADAITWTKAKSLGSVQIKSALTYMWGCGDSCDSTSVLVDVASPLAKMKSGLMDYFEKTKGMEVDRTAWGGTAHIQVVFNER